MEPKTAVPSPEVRRPTWSPSAAWGPSQTTLCVGRIMSKEVVTAAPNDALLGVAQKMSAQSLSCVVIIGQGRVVGILTQKDMLNAVAGESPTCFSFESPSGCPAPWTPSRPTYPFSRPTG